MSRSHPMFGIRRIGNRIPIVAVTRYSRDRIQPGPIWPEPGWPDMYDPTVSDTVTVNSMPSLTTSDTVTAVLSFPTLSESTDTIIAASLSMGTITDSCAVVLS